MGRDSFDFGGIAHMKVGLTNAFLSYGNFLMKSK